MAKQALTAFSVVAILTLLAEGLAGGLLWSQGRLNSEAIREIREILKYPEALAEERELAAKPPSSASRTFLLLGQRPFCIWKNAKTNLPFSRD